jgi:hypothetical protein
MDEASRPNISKEVSDGHQSWLFSYTGSPQNFTSNEGGSYKLEVWGGQGGNASCSVVIEGGKGGYSVGVYFLQPKQTIYIYVGGEGESGSQGSSGNTKYGGWNGGGNALSDGGNENANYQSILHGGGGGGTDIRLTLNTEYQDRLIVAGGGAGSGGEPSSNSLYRNSAKPGDGGGINGTGSFLNTYDGQRIGGGGGTQTSGGSGGTYFSNIGQQGVFGIGGNSTTTIDNYYPGGGGGGYDGGCPGGGGSGYIGGFFNQTIFNIIPITISGDQEIPNPLNPKETIIGNSGPGYAQITLATGNICPQYFCSKITCFSHHSFLFLLYPLTLTQ